MNVDRYRPTLAEQAAASRKLRFANSTAETNTLHRFDGEMTVRVRRVESLLIDQALAFGDHVRDLSARADRVRSDLKQIEVALNANQEVDLAEWSRVDSEARLITELAVALPDRLADLLVRLDDPVAYATQLQERYPALHRPVLLPDA